MRIKYPFSLWASMIAIIANALTSVALHGVVFYVVVATMIVIGFLPWLSRQEVKWHANKKVIKDLLRDSDPA